MIPSKILSKQLSIELKGIATILVLAAHCAQWYMAQGNADIFIRMLTKLGRYGVSIFFVVSGYGLVCSVEEKIKIESSFLKRRFVTTYIPYVLITGCMLCLQGTKWNLKELCRLIWGMDAWFVLVIMLCYVMFFFGWNCFNNKVMAIEVGIFIISIILAAIFRDSLWYSSNISFGIGIIVKTYEKSFYTFVNRCWGWISLLLLSGFIISAYIYACYMDKNYGVYLFFKIMASAVWSILILTICIRVPLHSCKPLEKLGSLSLECYLFYPHIYMLLSKGHFKPEFTILLGVLLVICFSILWHKFYYMVIKRKVIKY